VGHVQRDHADEDGRHQRCRGRIVPVEDRREQERDHDDPGGHQAGQRPHALPPPQGDHGDHEQPPEGDQRRAALEVVEPVLEPPLDLGLVHEDDLVPVVELHRCLGDRQLEGRLVPGR
jgi:hypothetical protein